MANTDELIARLEEHKAKLAEIAATATAQQQATDEAKSTASGIKSDLEELAQILANLGTEGSLSLANQAMAKIEELVSMLDQTHQQTEQSSMILSAADGTVEEARGFIEQIRSGTLLTTVSKAGGPKSPHLTSSTSSPPTTTPPSTTRPSMQPDPDRKPRGPISPIEGSADKKRGIELENESALLLAQHGYDVEQNPPGRDDNNKEPDYRLEGEYADAYSPQSKKLKKILDNVKAKVGHGPDDEQARRIVLNLDRVREPVDLDKLRSAIEKDLKGSDRMRRLQEIKIIRTNPTTGKATLIDFYPFKEDV